jgi:hypothetical protein
MDVATMERGLDIIEESLRAVIAERIAEPAFA